MSKGDIESSYEEFIPTDKWSLQDWYLLRIMSLDSIYTKLMSGYFGGALDRRALVDFYSSVRAYLYAARQNMKKHLGENDFEKLVVLINTNPDDISIASAEKIMELLSVFHWGSGLTKLSESRPMGDFARARARVGMDLGKGGRDGQE